MKMQMYRIDFPVGDIAPLPEKLTLSVDDETLTFFPDFVQRRMRQFIVNHFTSEFERLWPETDVRLISERPLTPLSAPSPATMRVQADEEGD